MLKHKTLTILSILSCMLICCVYADNIHAKVMLLFLLVTLYWIWFPPNYCQLHFTVSYGPALFPFLDSISSHGLRSSLFPLTHFLQLENECSFRAASVWRCPLTNFIDQNLRWNFNRSCFKVVSDGGWRIFIGQTGSKFN